MFCIRTFCPSGRFVPPDILSPGRFVPPAFYPTDVMSLAVMSPDVLSPDVLSCRTICLGTAKNPLPRVVEIFSVQF
jgi:hypothetical protein